VTKSEANENLMVKKKHYLPSLDRGSDSNKRDKISINTITSSKEDNNIST